MIVVLKPQRNTSKSARNIASASFSFYHFTDSEEVKLSLGYPRGKEIVKVQLSTAVTA